MRKSRAGGRLVNWLWSLCALVPICAWVGRLWISQDDPPFRHKDWLAALFIGLAVIVLWPIARLVTWWRNR